MSSSTNSKWNSCKMTNICGNMKSYKETNKVSMVDIPTLLFVFWPKISSLLNSMWDGVLLWYQICLSGQGYGVSLWMHYHKIQKLEGRMFALREQIYKDNSSVINIWSALISPSFSAFITFPGLRLCTFTLGTMAFYFWVGHSRIPWSHHKLLFFQKIRLPHDSSERFGQIFLFLG